MFKVILLDDDETVQNCLRADIDWETYGCEVVDCASNAARGVNLVREHRANILFTDACMPGVDAMKMAEALLGEFPLLQIAVLTNITDFMFVRRAMHAGVARYLLKPHKKFEVCEALEFMTARLKLLRLNETAEAADDEESEDAPRVSSFIARNALKYIEEHYAERITLQQVAENTFVSQWYLSKLLKKHVGDNFADTLHKARISAAKELLMNPALRVHEISDMVGYTDAAHFSKVFKRFTGLSAGEYRDRQL
ncbi:hypothetical protein FACS1894202_07210 [Clostridia bacterium]|nr:hypothetical protein FACS1894202_07210 [Clostridia bacterium]